MKVLPSIMHMLFQTDAIIIKCTYEQVLLIYLSVTNDLPSLRSSQEVFAKKFYIFVFIRYFY